MPEFRNINGHIEVYLNNTFLFSADTIREAIEELNKIVKLNVVIEKGEL